MVQFGENKNGAKGERGNMIRDSRIKAQSGYDKAKINSKINDNFQQTSIQHKGDVETNVVTETLQTKIGAPPTMKELNDAPRKK